MTYQALARKWRPRQFADVVGQEHVVKALENALTDNRLHPALLFSGTRGVGKTTLARIVAKRLNCLSPEAQQPCGDQCVCTQIDEGRFVDLFEVDAASRTKVDDTRELLDNVQYAPAQGQCKVYLIDEVHMLSKHSFNALLKTLEEPPSHVRFLLATTDPQKIPVTILSRCLQFHLKRHSVDQIDARVQKILTAESIQFEPAATVLLAKAADGSLRDALSLLDQAIAHGAGQVNEITVREMLGSIDQGDVAHLLHSVLTRDAEALSAAFEHVDSLGLDYEQLIIEVAELLQETAHAQFLNQKSLSEAAVSLAAASAPEHIQLLYQIALHGRKDLPWSPGPRSAFRMMMLRMFAFRPQEAASAAGGQGQQNSGRPQPTKQQAVANPNSNLSASDAPPWEAEDPGYGGTIQEPKPSVARTEVRVDATSRQQEAIDIVDGTVEADWRGTVESLGLRGISEQLALNSVAVRRSETEFCLYLEPVFAELLTERSRDRLTEVLKQRFGENLVVSVEIAKTMMKTPAQEIQAERAAEQARAIETLRRDPGARMLLEQGAVLDEDSVHFIH